jgi:hypothetical protein
MKAKLLLIFILFSFDTKAQLIFKSGFENTGFVSGTTTGLTSGSFQLQLSSSEGSETKTINENGVFVFEQELPIGTSYSVSVHTLPSGQFCSISNGAGTMTNGGVDNVVVNCGNANNWDEMNWNEGEWQ